MSKKQSDYSKMPKLTIDGKRQIIEMARKAMGDKALTSWVKSKDFASIKDLHQQVRKKKAGFFRELYELYLLYRS